MSYKTASCILCTNPKRITAEKQQWQIHVAKHRNDMIKFVRDKFDTCVLCTFPITFTDKNFAAQHLRWNHSKKSLIDWFYKNILLKEKSSDVK